MDLFDDFRAQSLAQPTHRLRIRNLLRADPCEHPINQVGAYFSFQRFVAPPPDVFQYHQPDHDFRWCPHAATCRALRMSPSQCFVDPVDQFFVVEDLVGLLHPGFPPILDRRVEKPLGDLPLSVVSFDHGTEASISNTSASVQIGLKNYDSTLE